MSSKKLIARNRRKRRIKAKIRGTAERPRLVVFRSIHHTYAQLVDDDKKVVLLSSSDLKDKNKGKKVEKAAKIGKDLAKKAIEKKIATVVFDRNGYKYHGRVKAIAEGAREGGLKL
ncbi:50S ribosomal protein L18 [Patescibacteria group bacterium]